MTYADLRALGFYRKMGFTIMAKGSPERARLLKQVENCTYSELMLFQTASVGLSITANNTECD